MSSVPKPADYSLYHPHPVQPSRLSLTADGRYAGHWLRLLRDATKDPHSRQPSIRVTSEGYTLYKATGLSLYPLDTLFSRSRQWLRELGVADVPLNAFPGNPPAGFIHLLLVTPEILESLDDIGDLAVTQRKIIHEREKEAQNVRNTLPAPSDGISTSSDVRKVVINLKERFHAGRPDDNHDPLVALFNKTLGLLAYRLRHLDSGSDSAEIEPGDIECRTVHLFIKQSLDCYDNDKTRLKTIKGSLTTLLGWEFTWDTTIAEVRPDALAGSPPYAILEGKNEAGLGGDASLQAGRTLELCRTSWASDDWRQTILPSLISTMGDLLEIGIAVYTDGPYIDRIFSERLRLDFHRNETVRRVARVFSPLVKAFVTTMRNSPPPSIVHLFPSPLPNPSHKGNLPSLTFTGRLSRAGQCFIMADSPDRIRSGIFLAVLHKPGANVEVVVKFAAGYNAEAHRILADAGLAPTLHACVPVCDRLFMVVMGRVRGQTAWAFQYERQLLPYSIYADVKAAVELLHQHDLVFGDFRSNNIVREGDSGHAVLVDFDSVGTPDTSFYPAVLNDELTIWAPGMRRCALMQKAHDLYMLEQFKTLCHENPA